MRVFALQRVRIVWVTVLSLTCLLAGSCSGGGQRKDELTPAADNLRIVARADVFRDAGAQVSVLLNGRLVQGLTVATPSWSGYDVRLPRQLRAGDRLGVSYDNDDADGSGDRNLWIRSIRSGRVELSVPSEGMTYTVMDRAGSERIMPSDVLPAMRWGGMLNIAWPADDSSRTPGAHERGTVMGPVRLGSGAVLRGQRLSNPSGTCVEVVDGAEDVLIEDTEIGPCGNTVEDVGIYVGPRSSRVVVRGNVIHDVASAVIANHARHPLQVRDNYAFDIRGPFPRGQMVQLLNVSGGVGGTLIENNVSDAAASTTRTMYEDHVNVYKSNGSADSPIRIRCNRIRGGDSTSGSGILVGDSGGSYISVENNVIALTPNTGIGVAGGSHVRVTGNVVYEAGSDAESLTQSAVNVMSLGGEVATDVLIQDNRGIARGWISSHGDMWGGYWSDEKGRGIVMSGNSWRDSSLNASVFTGPLAGC